MRDAETSQSGQTTGGEEKSDDDQTAARLQNPEHLLNEEIAIGGRARLAKHKIGNHDVELTVFEGQEQRVATTNFDAAYDPFEFGVGENLGWTIPCGVIGVPVIEADGTAGGEASGSANLQKAEAGADVKDELFAAPWDGGEDLVADAEFADVAVMDKERGHREQKDADEQREPAAQRAARERRGERKGKQKNPEEETGSHQSRRIETIIRLS